MIKHFITVLLLSSCGWAAITLNGHKITDNGSSNATTVVISNLTKTAGDLITCEVTFAGASTLTSVADSLNAGNYTAAVAVHKNTTMDQYVGIYYKENTVATANLNITLTYSPTNAYAAMACQTWTGAATSSSLDLQPAARDSSGVNPQLTSSSTPAENNEVVISVDLFHASTPTVGSGFHSPILDTTGGGTNMSVEYWIQTTATATPGDFVAATDTAWTVEMASFKTAAATAVDMPTYDNDTGTYYNNLSVTISDTTSGATICYTTDGSTPAATTPGTCSTGTTYSTPVSITATGTVLKSIGTKAAMTNSSEKDGTYTLTVGSVISTPVAGTYAVSQSVTLAITTTTGGTIRYTLDGSTPSCPSTGTLYSGAISVSTTTTVKAIGCKSNYVSSGVLSSLYTITGPAHQHVILMEQTH